MIQPPFDYTSLFLRYKGLAKELPFTKEDVDLLRTRADREEEAHQYMGSQFVSPLRNLAERIEALLPKEKE